MVAEDSEGRSAPKSDAEVRKAYLREPKRLDGPVTLSEYDPAWPERFDREAGRIRSALGERVLALEHVGSTSVPGLAAKPIIDVLLVVADSADEPSYAPALEEAGYVLTIREPDWHQHRLFKGPDADANVHVFSRGSGEIMRMVSFRDWLRANPADRNLYLATKRDLARRNWKYVQNYADAKSKVIDEILARATSRER